MLDPHLAGFIGKKASSDDPGTNYDSDQDRICPDRKLRRYVDLDDEEVGALTRLLMRTRGILRCRDIVVQGQPYRALYVLLDGLALRYKVLPDGRRQVLNLIGPGDP